MNYRVPAFPHSDSVVYNFAPGEEVVGEGDPADHFYMVVKGMFRAVKVTRDGRRQSSRSICRATCAGWSPARATT